MRKPTICIGKNKVADQLPGNPEAYQPVCVRPVWNLYCWFSHAQAHIYVKMCSGACKSLVCECSLKVE